MSEIEMKIDPARASALISQFHGVSERIATVAKGRAVRCFYFLEWIYLHACTISITNIRGQRSA